MFEKKGALRKEMSNRFRSTRARLGISQEKMAELLEIDRRSYSDLEHGKSLCSTQVFLRYLLVDDTNVLELLEDLKVILNTK